MTGTLVVFAKWPEPGAVKTRLCPPLTPEQAAAFYDAMLGDVLDATAREAPRRGLALALAVTPAERARDFSARAPAYRVFAQQGADLSQRMEHAAASELARGAQRVLLRGSDSPALAPEVLDAALAALARVDVALSPDRDGGYNLVALRRFAPGLFAHAMSTSTVLDDTRTAAARLGLASEVLAPGFDIDTAADFAPLREARPRASALCPRTYAWLDAHAELTRA
ncbi:MAG: TIGR04282 family arsenosugar biosynthesis glycosyltransferase [Deltaproteobacteria bacterium]|nr:TIGR04282 family arsenosugar biosynthesis glycosyltransferase [Deltaproteobacteria bacterium]